MPKPRAQYVDTRTLIDSSPNLVQIAAIPTPSADKLLIFNDGTKEFEVADIGTGLVLTGGALDADGGGLSQPQVMARTLGC